MFHSTGRKLTLLFVGVVGFAVIAGATTLSVQWKPWGVRDHQRDEYEQVVANLRTHAALREKLETQPHAEVRVSSDHFQLGVLQPDQVLSCQIELSNAGSMPLMLEPKQAKVGGLSFRLNESSVEPGEKTSAILSGNANDFYDDESDASEADESLPSVYNTVVIETNDPLRPTVTLLVTGRHASPLVVPDVVQLDASDPGVEKAATFSVYSETSDEMQVTSLHLKSGQELDWLNDDSVNSSLNLPDTSRALNAIRLAHTAFEYGKFNHLVVLVAKVDGEEVVQEFSLKGKVRSPIVFISPKLDKRDGLNIGTIQSNEESKEYVGVKIRGDEWRELAVLDHRPVELNASLRKLKLKGSYQLTLTIPKDCPTVIFNRNDHHGYVKVGDPKDPQFSSWFPIVGAVVP